MSNLPGHPGPLLESGEASATGTDSDTRNDNIVTARRAFTATGFPKLEWCIAMVSYLTFFEVPQQLEYVLTMSNINYLAPAMLNVGFHYLNFEQNLKLINLNAVCWTRRHLRIFMHGFIHAFRSQS